MQATSGPVARAGDPAAGWCLKTDMNYDRTRTLTDVDLFVTALLAKPIDVPTICAGDLTGDGSLNGLDIAQWITVWLSPDSDGDGIPNVFETNNGVFGGATDTGSDPNNADTDGDSLSDGDEVYDTVAGLDLHAMGCSPVRKNICIEADWFDDAEGAPAHSHRPGSTAINQLKTAFTNSPVVNPYGGPTGITVVFDNGSGGAFTGGNLIPGGDTIVLFDSEFNTYKAANFNPNRNGYFHYSIFCHRYNSATNNSSGVAELPGDDFIVSLQNFLTATNISRTIMHELGHNLNIRHGGFENLNYKPNYNSVMNYRYQFPGVDLDISCNAIGDGILDYSRGTRITLNENSLDEAAGVCGATAIDWDGDTVISAGVARNITCAASLTFACGSSDPLNCNDTVCSASLADFNDWAAVSFTGIFNADFIAALPEIITCQDTPPRPAPSE